MNRNSADQVKVGYECHRSHPKKYRQWSTALPGAFNSKNSKLFNDSFGGEVAIIDGFAPFRWSGPNAQARWWAEAELWVEELGVASEHISVEKTLHCQVVGTRAYAVLSATLTIGLKKGESIIRPGILHIHHHKAGRGVEGRVADLGSVKLRAMN